MIDTDLLGRMICPGDRVAFADGGGAPLVALEALSYCAGKIGGIELMLGWCPWDAKGLDPAQFASVRTVMGGYGLRRLVDAGSVGYIPCRLGTVPALLAGPLRPDVVIVSAARVDGAWQLTTEASWITAAVAGAARVLVVERPLCPVAVDEPALPIQRVTVIGSDPEPSVAIPAPEISQDHHAIGRLIAPLIPEGARVQFGPGPIGAATLQELSYPVQIDTGIINDSVVDLDARGLVMGEPLAPYALGSPAVYRWIEGRPMLRAISHTHDPARLAAGPPLMAVNTALEMDLDGQVNLERVGGSTVGGVGGHPDYSAAAATSCNGLSIVALPSVWAGRSTLVQRLEAPTTTSRSDIDIVVTEHGLGDLRGLDSGARRSVIRSLWAEVN